MILFLIGVCGFVAVSSQILGLREGEDCRPLGGGQGACKLLSQCKGAEDFKTNRPPICSFKDKEPIICCPSTLTTRVQAGHKAEQLCTVLDIRCRRNLNISKNVIGGVPSAPRTQIFAVLIGYGNMNEREWSCGGSLITAKYVLSAAHCVNPVSLGPARWARVGELDTSSDKDDAKPVDKRIVERITHPDYTNSRSYHDIALFKLDSDVAFNAWVMPVCLQTKKDIEDDVATVTGWGRIDFAGSTSEKLLEADLTIYNDTECQRLMFTPSTSRTPQGYQSKFMFCAGVPDGSKDACLGDSGGPLVIRKLGECIKTQIGITSYGKQCGLRDSPGVYTRVSNYVSWIEGIVFEDEIII